MPVGSGEGGTSGAREANAADFSPALGLVGTKFQVHALSGPAQGPTFPRSP